MTETVDKATWQAARAELLEREKAHTRAADTLAAMRRQMPRLRVESDYAFFGEEGPRTLGELFEGRRQLIVYHHMLRPQDPDPCAGCCMFVDQFGHPAHLHARDTSRVVVSRAPLEEIQAFRARMGWTFPWFETRDTFNRDHDVTGGFGLNVFLREGEAIYRTYFTSGRGVESLGSVWSFLDLTPLGRQESWESSPEGVEQGPPYAWWRLHDAYEPLS